MMNHFVGGMLLAAVIIGNVPRAVRAADAKAGTCRILADQRINLPLTAIAKEFQRRSGARLDLNFLPIAELTSEIVSNRTGFDAVFCMAGNGDKVTAVASLANAVKVAWKHPGGAPVWAAAVGQDKTADAFIRFTGGPSGHLLWSESPAGFTIVGDRTHAAAIEWVAENRVRHTYPLTAARMLAECGIREGTCIDIGCGTGALDVELAQRSQLTIIGLDIDAEMKPLFDKRIGAAQLQDRVRFVAGDAQDLPFPDDFADVIVSRGTLTFIPDIGKCLREVDRVLKPTGVAFLGGRYLYTPYADRITTDQLRRIVADTGIVGAQVITARGQWVKIVGPKAKPVARRSGLGPLLLAHRCVADYPITAGKCLLICMNDGAATRGLQQGFVDATQLQITALYPSKKMATEAQQRITKAGLDHRISCQVGTLDDGLSFVPQSFDLIAGIGPVLIWGNREQKMRDIYRVLRPGGAALLGGKYLGMPDFRRVSNDDLRASAAKAGITSIRVINDMGQWVEIRKGIKDHGLRD